MKNRRSIVFVLAVLLLVAVFPVSASATGNRRSTKVRGSCKIPQIAIEVTVPTGTHVYLNPTKAAIKTNHTIQDGQIISETAYIENKSVVPVSVSTAVTGKVKIGSNMVLRPASTQGSSSTAKDAFVYFEIQTATDPTSEPWDSAYNAGKHIVLGTTKKAKENMVTLGAVDEDDRYGVFHLTGDCITAPSSPWTVRDGFYADIVFTFLPTVKS